MDSRENNLFGFFALGLGGMISVFKALCIGFKPIDTLMSSLRTAREKRRLAQRLHEETNVRIVSCETLSPIETAECKSLESLSIF